MAHDFIHYRNVIEALGMGGRLNSIHNKLNHVLAHSTDLELKNGVGELLEKMKYHPPNTDAMSIHDHRSLNVEKLENYCVDRLSAR
ncbi:MAG: hypothetical protein PHY50_02660 [Sideroxydans sp.]|nr:hypothetical protein [Sideroxydans sp.]